MVGDGWEVWISGNFIPDLRILEILNEDVFISCLLLYSCFSDLLCILKYK